MDLCEVSVAHMVALLINGVLVRLEPSGRRAFSYTHPKGGEPGHVEGALIDERFVPRDSNPVILKGGDTFEVTEEEVVYALENVRPIERHKRSKLQIITAIVVGESADVLDADEIMRVTMPSIMLDPVELPAAWMQRVYVTRSDPRHPEPGYERDLVLRMPDGDHVLHEARPAGTTDEGHLMIRFNRHEPA